MTETMQAVNTVMDSDAYALVLRTIERNALLDQRELVTALYNAHETVRKLLNGEDIDSIPEADPQAWGELIAKAGAK
jgi:hypothetical protein